MSTIQAENDEVDVIEEIDATVDASDAPEDGADGSEDAGEDTPAEVVSFDEGSPPRETSDTEQAPQWLKDLRAANREKDKKIRELESRVNSTQPVKAAPALGPKPTLEGHDYDAEEFEKALDAWHEKRREVDQHETAERAKAQEAEKGWKSRLETYATGKAALKDPDFEDSEIAVQGALDQIQQGIIIQGSEASAKMVLALGRSPKKLAELAAIKDPVKFAIEIGKLESKMNGNGAKRSPPPPESQLATRGQSRGVSDSKLEQLRRDAEKTGDYTKVTAYKRQFKR